MQFTCLDFSQLKVYLRSILLIRFLDQLRRKGDEAKLLLAHAFAFVVEEPNVNEDETDLRGNLK